MEVLRAGTLTEQGQSRTALVRRTRAGELFRVRHGAYASALEPNAIGRHRQLIEATWPLLDEDAVLSHSSAAVLHGLPVWESMLGSVFALRPDGGHGGRTRSLHMRLTRLAATDVILVDGYRVTSIARTAVDQACVLRHDRAVATMDAALRSGVPRARAGRRGASSTRAARGRSGTVGAWLRRRPGRERRRVRQSRADGAGRYSGPGPPGERVRRHRELAGPRRLRMA